MQKAQKRVVQVWGNETIEKLQTCFQITDWNVFFKASNDINEVVNAINDYIIFCPDLNFQSRTVSIYPNNKPWITKNMKEIINAQRDAFAACDLC